jgi:hypothetical protein
MIEANGKHIHSCDQVGGRLLLTSWFSHDQGLKGSIPDGFSLA